MVNPTGGCGPGTFAPVSRPVSGWDTVRPVSGSPLSVTLVDELGSRDMPGDVIAGRLLAEPSAFAAATGWELKPEGLCRDDVCVPVRDRAALSGPAGELLDVVAVAEALGRIHVADPARRVVALGDRADIVSERMQELEAPAFTLPDLDGRPTSLADFDRRKRLLLAWSSW